MSANVHGWRRGLRWTKRIVLGLLALVVVAIGAALIFIHTDYGRDTVREKVVAELQNTFINGMSIGKLEGSPLGELVLRDVVIDGPDHKPAITIGTLRARIKLLKLIDKQVQIKELVVEDVDIAVKRDADGKLEIGQLVKPSDPNKPASKSTWNINLPSVKVQRAHVMVDTGSPDAGVVDLDDLELAASAHLPADGARSAWLQLDAMWRQRKQPISIVLSASDDGTTAKVPSLRVFAGKVSVTGSNLAVTRRDGKAPMLSGLVQVVAAAADVSALVPRVQLPADIALAIDASAGAEQTVAVSGTVGMTPVHIEATGDVDAKRFVGKLSTGELDISTMTRGKIPAVGGVAGTFEVAMGAPGDLPDGNLRVSGRGVYQDLPGSEFSIAIDSHGNHVSTAIDVTGAAKASITAEVRKAGDALSLENASVVASTRDPAKASGGKAPLHGSLEVSLTAHGALTPKPSLAVAGTIQGRALRMTDLSVASLDVKIDAKQLPGAPLGKASVRLVDIVRGDMQLGALNVNAANRTDGKIAVDVSSQPKQNPWLVDISALVTPPAKETGRVVVDIQRHRIRAGNGVDWIGTTGHLVIDPAQIELTDLRSASAEGKLAVAGTFVRAGKGAGDIRAKVDVDRFTLDALRRGYTGLIDAHVDVARNDGRWAGGVNITAAKVALQPNAPTVDLTAKIAARPDKVTVDASVSGNEMGSVKLALDVAAPARLEDIAAWKAKGRDALRTARVQLQAIDLARVASLVSPTMKLAGRVDGEIELGATTKGHIQARGIKAPQLRGVRWIDADLDLAQTAPAELTPTLTVKVADVGNAVAQAHVALPARVFDPAAWKKLGTAALHGASVKTDVVTIDPAMLARLGITSTMHGRASFKLDVAPDLASIQLAAVVDDLRGTPFAQPVSVHVGAVIDTKSATASIEMTQQGKPLTLMKIDGKVPVSIDQLHSPGLDIKSLPLSATLVLPKTSAPQLLNVFGRTEVTTGSLDGKVSISGTVGKPVVTAHIVGENLGMPPGPGHKAVKTVRRVAIDASYDDKGGKLVVDGTEDQGGKLRIEAAGSPAALAEATAKITATSFDMTPLLAFAPGPAGGARGTLDANLTVKGFDPRTAKVLGDLHVKDARIPLAPALGTLRKANVDISIHEHDIKVAATGKLGGGDVKLDGSIKIDGVALTGGQAKLTLRKISPIGAVEPQIDADITTTIARTGNQWHIDAIVDNGFVKVTKSSGEKLKPSGNPSDLTIGAPKQASATGAPQPPKQPAIIIQVTLRPTKVESEEFRTTLFGNLKITADADAIGMVGVIEAQSGDLDLFDRRYRLEQAAVTFDGTIDPRVDVRITHDFPDVTTVTAVRGRMSKPKLELSANPGNYTQSQLLGFLLGGEPGGDPSSGSARDKAQDAGTSFIANQIGGYMKKALPFDIDVIRYEAAGVGSSAAITVGSWITHTLFFAFRQHLDARPDENSGEGTLEYWITRRLEIEATAGDRNYDGLDILWRRRF